MAKTLILGGARSGKSAFAARAAEAVAGPARPVMIVTAEAGDAEMAERIAHHRAARGDRWRTVEAPLALPDAIANLTADDVAVVDCLTLWVSNLLLRDDDVAKAGAQLCAAVIASPARLWLVSNEVGGGIVPENALAREFRDVCGRLHQDVAAACDHALLVVAGLPLSLK